MGQEVVEFLALLVELVKGLAWPAAIVIVAFAFKPDLHALFPRLRRAGPSGVEFDPLVQQNAAIAETRAAASAELLSLPGIERTPTIAMVEKRLHEELAFIDEGKKINLLVALLAQSRVEHGFSATYNTIFGSQIGFLRYLERVGHAPATDAQVHFERARANSPDIYGEYGFGGWMGFMVGQGLVRREGDTFEITTLGRDFLSYLTSRKLAEVKLL